MTPDRDPTIRALLEQRLDALSDDLLQNTIMLRDGHSVDSLSAYNARVSGALSAAGLG